MKQLYITEGFIPSILIMTSEGVDQQELKAPEENPAIQGPHCFKNKEAIGKRTRRPLSPFRMSCLPDPSWCEAKGRIMTGEFIAHPKTNNY